MHQKSSLRLKLEEFVQKYHQTEVWRGLFLLGALALGLFLALVSVEYFFRLNTAARTFLFWASAFSLAYVVIKHILLPILRLVKWSKTRLSLEQAAVKIGSHFTEISDKLLNALQLEDMSQQNAQSNELLLAAISQKTKELSPLPFHLAIDKKEVKRFAKYSSAAVLILFVLAAFNKKIIQEGSHRLLHFSTHFEKPAPFDFVILNKELKTYKNTDFELVLKTEGKQIPEEVLLVWGGNPIKMEKSKAGIFRYTLKNVMGSQSFYFSALDFISKEFSLSVIPVPSITSFQCSLQYPDYLQKTNEKLSNVGNLSVPEGTIIKWNIKTSDAEVLHAFFENKKVESKKINENEFELSVKAGFSMDYGFVLSNSFSNKSDTAAYFLEVQKDLFPTIVAEQQADSVQINLVYLFGDCSDDHGLHKLALYFREKNSNSPYYKKQLPITDNFQQSFFVPFLTTEYKELQNKEIEYYFEVWDNDKNNGYKSSKTSIGNIKTPSTKELEEKTEQSGQAISAALQNKMAKAIELQKKAAEMQKALQQKSTLNWEDKQKLEDLLKEQKKLSKEIEALQEQNKERNQIENQFKNKDQELLQKQKELEKLFNELLDDKTKEQFKKLEELLKQNQKDKLQNELNELNKDNKDLEKMLDRALEQFKQLELEKKVNETVEKLEELAKKQQELSQKTENAPKSEKEALQQQQEEIKKEFEELKKDLNDIKQKNNNLETPLDLHKTEKEEQSVGNKMQDSEENIQKGKMKNASQSQEEAAEEMEQMAKKMKEKMEEAQDEEEEEDYMKLRVLLKNLVVLSKEQEALLQEFKSIKNYNPRFIELSQKQKEIRQASAQLQDSLYALAKRQAQISSFVTKETSEMVYSMENALKHLTERDAASAVVRQQYAMTHANNLAVMLTEVLKNMQEQLNSKNSEKKDPKDGKPSASCKNPGKSKNKQGDPKSGMQGMQKLQDKLNKDMQDLMQGVKEGKQPTSKEFAKIAAQQEALRKELEKVEKQMKEDGESDGKGGDIGKTKELMEQTEKELYQKKINPELIQRQSEISHRLFEHEKAEREKGEKEERKGETAKTTPTSIPPSLEKYLKEKEKEVEFYRTLPPEFNPYYKQKVKEYFKEVQK